MSYRTTPNFKKLISAHNSKIISKKKPDLPCNCRVKEACPLDGSCRATNIVYQATLTTEQDPPATDTYIGLTENEFKSRFSNHKTSFKLKNHSKETTLSLKIWDLKNQQIPYNLKWKIIGRALPFSPITGVCNLCTLEKYCILSETHQSSLNKREEIFGKCRHKTNLLLISKPKR